MNKITIFQGQQNSGKTTQAIQISWKKISVWLFRNCALKYNLNQVEEYTQLLIFDDVRHSDIPHIAEIANKDFITFRQPYHKQPTMMKRPEMLVCTQLPAEEVTKLLSKIVPIEIVHFSN